ncbi:MAG: beta-ketoacyl-[acyl-carrier-protein] synthase family protein [Propionibacteriaceae bacterium]|nr:beta-ketoacyl-[acyl-carrier-protein] synthase family protein [Propionibacteriaceae bacterium]
MRIAVTGYGMITAAGRNAAESWQTLTKPECPFIENTITSDVAVYNVLGGQVTSLPYHPRATTDRLNVLSRIALQEALARAGLDHDNPYDPSRRALSLGTCVNAAHHADAFHKQWLHDGLGKADHLLLLQYPMNTTADILANVADLNGPRVVHANACSAGATAIGNAYEYLQDDMADMAVAGGVDVLSHLSYAGFCGLGAISHISTAPYTRSDGLTLGEGAGFLILEKYDVAVARGATIFAELLSYGLSADGYHPTAPDPRGYGILTAMTTALDRAGVSADQIDYINGHGTGTQANDSSELKVVMSLFNGKVPITSTKSMIGHTLGAAGAIEAAVCVMTIENQVIHPTYVPPDEGAQEMMRKRIEEGAVDIVPNKARPTKIDLVMSNSVAFGGSNASILLAKDRGALPPDNELPPRTVSVTAVSARLGSAKDCDELRAAFLEDQNLYPGWVTVETGETYPHGHPGIENLGAGVNPRVMRRADPLGKLSLDATAALFKKRQLSQSARSTVGIIFATASGPATTIEVIQNSMILRGESDSHYFPNTVVNAAAGHVAIGFGLRGPTSTICDGDTSGVSALHLAQRLIETRACDRILVIAAEEAPEGLISGYSRVPGYLSTSTLRPNENSGVVHSGGAAAVLLEADDVETERVPGEARVLGYGFTSDSSGVKGLLQDPTAWTRSYNLALDRAGLTADDIDVVISAAIGLDYADRIEAEAIKQLGLRESVPVIAPRGITGDTHSPGPFLAFLIADWLKSGDTLMVHGKPTSVKIEPGRPLRALVSSFCFGGNFQSMVIETCVPD